METDNDKTEVESSDDDKNYVLPRKPGHKRTSISWQFFDRDNDIFATCKICNKSISHRSAVSNLTKHIKRAHPSDFQKIKRDLQSGQVDEDISYLDFDEKNNIKSKQNEIDENKPGDILLKHSIWRYFTLLDKSLNIASCIVCAKRINFTTQRDLLHHIKKKHNNDYIPSKNARVFVSEDNDIFEIEELIQSKEKTMMEYDHLENTPKTTENYELSEVPRKKRIKFSVPQKVKQEMEEDHIDFFAKYVSSLLRKLPSQVSNKLQADFISQIMEASVPGTSEQVQVQPPVIVLPVTSNNENKKNDFKINDV